MSRYTRELSVALVYALLLVALWRFAPQFYAWGHLRTVFVKSAPVLIVVVGMTLVILARQIDISVGAQLSVCGIVAGLLAQSGLPMPLVAALTIAVGGALGAVNGGLVAGLGLPSIVVTLATMAILREGLLWVRQGEFVGNLPEGFQWFGLGQGAGQWCLVAIAAAVFAVFAWGLQFVAAGRAVYAVGSDPEAAFLAGLAPRRVTFGVFVALGSLAGLAALLSSVQFSAIDPKAGAGDEMKVIAAAVVGGVAISGGRGTLAGALLGVALLETVRPALVFLGAEAYWEKALQGAIILVAVATDRLQLARGGHGVRR